MIHRVEKLLKVLLEIRYIGNDVNRPLHTVSLTIVTLQVPPHLNTVTSDQI